MENHENKKVIELVHKRLIIGPTKDNKKQIIKHIIDDKQQI